MFGMGAEAAGRGTDLRASRAKEDAHLVWTQGGEERDAVTGRVCEESAARPPPPQHKGGGREGKGQGETALPGIYQVPPGPVCMEAACVTETQARGWRAHGCYGDPSRLLGSGGQRTPGLRAGGSSTSPPPVLPPSGNMQVPQACLRGGGAG